MTADLVDTLDAAAAAMIEALGPHTEADWSVPAGELDWSCWTAAAHIAHDLAAYTGQLAALPPDAYLPHDLRVRTETPPAVVLRVARGWATALATLARASPAGVRAWHWGPTDAGGFAALGANEILVHTWDIARGLGVRWLPPPGPALAVLARLFPDSPPGDPAVVLLWCTGRIALADHPRRTQWRLAAARG